MKKYFKVFLLLALILMFLLMILGVKNELTVYKFDVNGVDLNINNFTIVSNEEEYYIPNTYTITPIGENKNITSISLMVTAGEVILTDIVASISNNEYTTITPQDIINNNCKINKNTKLTIKLTYELDNNIKEYYYTVSLEDKKIEI